MINSTNVLENLNLSFDVLQNIQLALDETAIVAVTDRTGEIMSVNDRFCEISQYNREELLGQDHRILNSATHPKSFFKQMWSAIGSGATWHGDVCNRAKDGSLYWVKTSVVPFMDENGLPSRYISIQTDITAQKNIKKIVHIANHDDLTGLPNRRSLMKRLDKEIYTNKKIDSKFALISMNVNRFKSINERLSHKGGDLFLKEITERLKCIDKQLSSFYHLNGDEFVYVLNDVEGLEGMAEAIIGAFSESFEFYNYKFFATVSLGICVYPDHGETTSELFQNVDVAMMSAKQRKGNYYDIYNTNMKNSSEQSLVLETKIKQALQEDLFELHYQPKIDILNGNRLVGMEVLIRWTDEEFGFMPPDRFIPFAEECGLISAIGEWVLRQTALQMKEWSVKYECNLRVSVNISPIHIAEDTFVERLMDIMAETDANPNNLDLEITEMSMVNYNETFILKINTLKAMGITISIDDFGTGYSSLSYLKTIPMNHLKIDRTFIMSITDGPSGVAIVAAIISLAHALNMKVVAEGVEQQEELDILIQHKCEYVQGFFFSKPLPASEFELKIQECSILL